MFPANLLTGAKQNYHQQQHKNILKNHAIKLLTYSQTNQPNEAKAWF